MGGIPIPHFAAANMEAMKSAMSQSNPALTKKMLQSRLYHPKYPTFIKRSEILLVLLLQM